MIRLFSDRRCAFLTVPKCPPPKGFKNLYSFLISFIKDEVFILISFTSHFISLLLFLDNVGSNSKLLILFSSFFIITFSESSLFELLEFLFFLFLFFLFSDSVEFFCFSSEFSSLFYFLFLECLSLLDSFRDLIIDLLFFILGISMFMFILILIFLFLMAESTIWLLLLIKLFLLLLII